MYGVHEIFQKGKVLIYKSCNEKYKLNVNFFHRKKNSVTISTNEAYGKVTVKGQEKEHELMDIPCSSSVTAAPADIEGLYEVPSALSALTQPLPSIPPSPLVGGGKFDEIIYDVVCDGIPGN